MPSRLLVILLLAGPLGMTGCIDYDGALASRNQVLRERRDALEAQVRAGRVKFDERDRARQEQKLIEAKLERLREMIKQEREAGR
ncbi:MAG: hypothetical protein GX442_06215 [Candidatus Riflebacteria bacterium]|nr:hypothetical protein [Candidatus Riflebacteria bacterium]